MSATQEASPEIAALPAEAGQRVCLSGISWEAYEQLLESSGDAATTAVTLDDSTVFLVYGSGMGAPHHPAYWYSGLRGRFLRKVTV